MRREHYEQDAQAGETHWWWVARRRILRKVMQAYAVPDRSRSVLEVGCSTGSNLPFLGEFGTVSALELDAEAAEICRQRHPDVYLYNQPIPQPLDRQFQIICAFDVIEHIDDEASTVDWLHRHLTEDGTVFITVPAYDFLWSQYDIDAHHFRRYTRPRLVEALQARFDVHYTTYFNTHLFPIIALTRLMQRIGLVNLDGRDKEVGSSGLINAVLTKVFAAECLWVPHLRLPFGVSLVAVARKPAAARA